MTDDGLTRDVSACERLILLIRYVYHLHEKGELPEKNDLVRWGDIDKLREQCDVLAGQYEDMLATVEQYRP